MSGALPTTTEFKNYTLESMHPLASSTSHSGRDFDRITGGHKWLIGLKYNNSLSRAQHDELWGFVQKQRNAFDSFTLNLPDKNVPRGTATGTPLVNGASQNGTSIISDGWTINIPGIMKRGDLLKFNGHSKVYQVTDDANSNGSGQATINISPALHVSPADNETIIVNNVSFTVKLVSGRQEYDAEAGGYYGLFINVREFY